MTHDLHANLSERLVEAADILIGYTTNPHVDMRLRGEEAAFAMRKMLAGMRPKSAFIRLPLTPPSVTLLTAEGPYADMIQYGQRRMRESGGEIVNVTILGGFVFSDTPKNGVAIVVTAREDEALARALAREIADYGWSMRERFRRELMSVEAAAALALQTAGDPSRPCHHLFADAGDNPGGGGEGRTTWLLRALVEAEAKRVYYGSFFDPELALEAHRLGEGAEFEAVFNREGDTEFSKGFRAPARVLKLTDGRFVGRLGIYRGRLVELGPSAALRIGGPDGIAVIVIGARHQTADPMFFESFGLDIAEARVVCVKSRGHFRAGFMPWFPPSQVFEVDTAGLTSPVLDPFPLATLAAPGLSAGRSGRVDPARLVGPRRRCLPSGCRGPIVTCRAGVRQRPSGTSVRENARMQFRKFLIGAALAAVAAVPVSGQAATLTVGLKAEPSSIDPHYHNLGPNNSMAAHYFSRLVEQDDKLRLLPGLAVSWKPIDDTTWEFKLREGVKFHDGSDFNADDVLFTFERAPNVPKSPSSFAHLPQGQDLQEGR